MQNLKKKKINNKKENLGEATGQLPSHPFQKDLPIRFSYINYFQGHLGDTVLALYDCFI